MWWLVSKMYNAEKITFIESKCMDDYYDRQYS